MLRLFAQRGILVNYYFSPVAGQEITIKHSKIGERRMRMGTAKLIAKKIEMEEWW